MAAAHLRQTIAAFLRPLFGFTRTYKGTEFNSSNDTPTLRGGESHESALERGE